MIGRTGAECPSKARPRTSAKQLVKLIVRAARVESSTEKGPALIHTVALVYESLIVAVYPDNPDTRKLKIDDGVDGQSQRRGEDRSVQPWSLVSVPHSESRLKK